MINESYKSMLGAKSVIRELSEYATARGKEIGYENVFDFSLGNPSVAVPQEFTDEMIRLLKEEDTMTLHGYTPSLGNPLYKEEVAKSLNERFGMNYGPEHIFPTTGAAGAISHALRAVTKPGDELITFAPYFPEYGPYVTGAGVKLSVVPADTESFQINFDKFLEMLNPNVMAVLINTPNNPSGVAYSTKTLERLSTILKEKSAEYGHTIFLLSDEPYREIVFKGAEKRKDLVKSFREITFTPLKIVLENQAITEIFPIEVQGWFLQKNRSPKARSSMSFSCSLLTSTFVEKFNKL